MRKNLSIEDTHVPRLSTMGAMLHAVRIPIVGGKYAEVGVSLTLCGEEASAVHIVAPCKKRPFFQIEREEEYSSLEEARGSEYFNDIMEARTVLRQKMQNYFLSVRDPKRSFYGTISGCDNEKLGPRGYAETFARRARRGRLSTVYLTVTYDSAGPLFIIAPTSRFFFIERSGFEKIFDQESPLSISTEILKSHSMNDIVEYKKFIPRFEQLLLLAKEEYRSAASVNGEGVGV